MIRKQPRAPRQLARRARSERTPWKTKTKALPRPQKVRFKQSSHHPIKGRRRPWKKSSPRR